MNTTNNVVAPCGLACFLCDIYEKNLTSELAETIHNKMGVPKDAIGCKGCRQQDGNHFHLGSEGCATLNCVKAKGVDMCSECDDFPCELLAPTADQAKSYPHNMKVYNLCRIKKVGIEKWAKDEATTIREKYFGAKFVVGKGQAD